VTAYVTFKCNDTLPSGMPCRGSISSEADTGGPSQPSTVEKAWTLARNIGWTFQIVREDPDRLRTLDYCPSCTRRKAVRGA
jgi:hypothetical protein